MMINVSIIIPVYNVAETIAETIKSVLVQTSTRWEVVVVDDGSSDETVAIASQFAVEDSRIRVVSQANQGVCVARNTGIHVAQFDWLLFLDADDWILPQHLEKMTAALAADSTLDAVHCGWSRVAPDGSLVGERYGSSVTDLFPVLTRHCPFAIHACIVRKALIEAVGGFDVSLQTCEDWDLWQRIARMGARFGAVKEILAPYRMRPNSLSSNSHQFFVDAMQVLAQGHAPDPRVLNPHPNHAEGQPIETLPNKRLLMSSWLAGLLLGRGKDAQHLLAQLEDDCAPGLDPYWVAENVFESAIIPSCQIPAGWVELWFTIEPCIKDFLLALEAKSQATGLAHRAGKMLERKVLQQTQVTSPLTIGTMYAVRLEVTEPIVDIYPPISAECLYCVVTMEGTELGRLELPVCDGLVTGWVLKDAIASQFAWQILGRFFEQTVYAANHPNAHEEIGWTVFLQQVWGCPDWESDRFYNSAWTEEEATVIQNRTGWLAVKVSAELPSIEVTLPEIDIALTVGGVGVGVVTVPVEQNFVTAQALRVALTTASGLELCRACVREALLGKSLSDKTSLRSRLAESAKAKSQYPESFAASGLASMLGFELSRDKQTVVLGRRAKVMGTAASRRAMLPSLAIQELVEMSAIAGEPLIQIPSASQESLQVVYAPEIIWRSPAPTIRSHTIKSETVTYAYGRNHFETLFATQSVILATVRCGRVVLAW